MHDYFFLALGLISLFGTEITRALVGVVTNKYRCVFVIFAFVGVVTNKP
jgi:hypothetical protein